MLKWNSPDPDGLRHYRFLATPFDTFPHDIVENGEDDAVLISENLLATLISRGVARAMNDEEATAANENHATAVDNANEENIKSATEVEKKNKAEREKPPTKIDPSKPAPRVLLKEPPIQENSSQVGK